MIAVRFWGVRGSIPTPGPDTARYGGNTACVEVIVDGVRFICDAGTGIRELGVDLMENSGGQPVTGHLLFSHMHWDHIQGFPFFGPAYVPQNHFTIWGPTPGDRRYARLLKGQMNSNHFPVDFQDLGGTIEADDLGKHGQEIEGTFVRALAQQHPGGSYAYRFDKDGASVAYATDTELDLLLSEPPDDLNAMRLFPADVTSFFTAVDLLVADGQYSDQEYETRKGWGHPRASTVVDLAIQCGVKRLAITHHDPMHSDAAIDEHIQRCRQRVANHGATLDVFGAREGVEIRVG